MERRSEEAETLVEAALRVLNEPDPVEKARLGEDAGRRWLDGSISLAYRPSDPIPTPPDRPARLSKVKLVAPNEMPKLGKGGSLQSRQAMVHSLVHTESWAIDLSWVINYNQFVSFYCFHFHFKVFRCWCLKYNMVRNVSRI